MLLLHIYIPYIHRICSFADFLTVIYMSLLQYLQLTSYRVPDRVLSAVTMEKICSTVLSAVCSKSTVSSHDGEDRGGYLRVPRYRTYGNFEVHCRYH